MDRGKKGNRRRHPSSWKGILQVMVISHRGHSAKGPENTLAAFQKAIEIGSDMMELDVRLSKDGQVVVIHDETLERTTNSQGKVADKTLLELRHVDAGIRFGQQFSGEKIPILKQVLSLAKKRILLNIEIKNGYLGQYSIADLADRTLQEVRRAGMMDQVIFSSFYQSSLQRIRNKNLRAQLALLYHDPWDSLEEVIGDMPISILNLRKSFLTEKKIAQIHRERMKVNVYTVDKGEEMKKFIDWGIDGIITNHPERLLKILGKMPKGKGASNSM